MIGTIVNTFAIIIGGIIGLFLKGGIPEKISITLMNGLGLCVMIIGLESSLKGTNFLLVIISIVVGALLGEWIDIDNLLKNLGSKIEGKFKNSSAKISEGFVTSSLLFCVGAMAIVGSLESGLTGNYKTLYAKSVLDGISSIIFASTLGFGVILSAVSVFVYQGIITVAASLLKGVLIQSVINDVTAVGGILILGLAFDMLNIKKIKVANLLPAVFIPIIYQLIKIL